MGGLSTDLWQSVRLTIELAAITTVILLLIGTPIAWWLARSHAWWKEIVATILALPLVLPPTVLGFYLLLTLGPNGPGGLIAGLWGGRTLAFTFEGLVAGSVLWSKTPGLVKGEETLTAASFAKLSICNPTAAPYGAAAVQTMKALKVYETLQPKLVEGATITQAYQFVETGNAELGFVALSQLTGPETGSRWLVPHALYSPIRQDAVLLKSGAANEAATGFIAFLRGPEARAIIEKYGYVLDGQS